MIRVAIAFALALLGLGLCCWSGNWFGIGLIGVGLFLCPREDEVQARVDQTVLGYRRGITMGRAARL